MEYYKLERQIEEHQRQIRQEMAALRLQKEAMRVRPRQPSWFDRSMLALGNWMVATGESLRKRYRVAPALRRMMRRHTAG